MDEVISQHKRNPLPLHSKLALKVPKKVAKINVNKLVGVYINKIQIGGLTECNYVSLQGNAFKSFGTGNRVTWDIAMNLRAEDSKGLCHL